MPVKLVLGHVLRTALTAGVSVPQSEAYDPGDPELGFGRKSVSEPAYLNRKNATMPTVPDPSKAHLFFQSMTHKIHTWQ